MPNNRLHEVLSRCEAELQQVAGEAMSGGDYASARQGLELAEGVADLRQSLDSFLQAASSKNEPESTLNQETVKTASQPAKSFSTPVIPPKLDKQQKTSSKKSTKSAVKKSGKRNKYPRFAQQGDKLVKIGWSKRTKKEYTHKAPRSAVDALASHLRTRTQDGQLFTIDELLPISDPENEGDLPTYQVYLSIAWLRDLGTLHKHGHDGYSIEHQGITKQSLSQDWEKLIPYNI